MLYHLLALLDILAAGSMVLGHYDLVRLPVLYAAFYLVFKLAFFHDVLTWIDAAAGVYLVFVFFHMPSGLTWVFLAWFIYKTCAWLFFSLTT